VSVALLVAVMVSNPPWLAENPARTIWWGLFAIATLDLLLSALRICGSVLARIVWRVRSWWRHRHMQPIPPSDNSVDQPVTTLADDQLAFAKYAFVLASFIAHCPTPMTVGIHGEWGAGKTSLASMIQQFLTPRDDEAGRQLWSLPRLAEIKDDLKNSGRDLDSELRDRDLRTFRVVPLNAWQYANAASLWRALILKIARRMEEDGLVGSSDEWQNKLYYSIAQEGKGEIRLSGAAVAISAVGAILAYTASLLLPSTWLLLALGSLSSGGDAKFKLPSVDNLFQRSKYTKLRKQMESIEEFKDELELLIRRWLGEDTDRSGHSSRSSGPRVIFFIDDLDRCLPSVALEIMETVKTFLDIPGCVYILLCDERLIGQGVKAKFKDAFDTADMDAARRGQAYIEKIVQVSFQIPPLNQDKLQRYAEDALRDKYANQKIPYFEVVHAAVGDNPRKIKRLCRGLEIAFEMMQLSLGGKSGTVERTPENALTNGRSVSPPSTLSIEPRAISAPNRVITTLDDRKRGFAKTYCLLYRWPETITALREFQSRGSATPPRVPAAIEALAGTPDDQLTAEERNLRAVYQALNDKLGVGDGYVFRPWLVKVDWERAALIGGEAVINQNSDLSTFLETEPFFSEMALEELRDYIEWSGVIRRETEPDSEALRVRAEISPILYSQLRKFASGNFGRFVTSDVFRSELRALRSMGFITMREGMTIAGLPERGAQLSDMVSITPMGLEALETLAAASGSGVQST
jgi:hypothetical protein